MEKNKVLTCILIVLNFINFMLVLLCTLYKNNLIFKELDSYEMIASVIILLAIIFEVYCFIFLLDIILGKNIYNKTYSNLMVLCVIYGVLLVCFLVPMLILSYDFIMMPLIILSPMIFTTIMLVIKLFRKKCISRFSIYIYILVPLVYIFTASICISHILSFGGIV